MTSPDIPLRPCFRCGVLTNETQSVYGVGHLRCFYLTPPPLPANAVQFTVRGEPASKANSRKHVNINGTPRSIKSAKARSFEQVCLLQIPPAAKAMWACDVEVQMKIFYASRRPDLDESVVLDCLQAKFSGTGPKRKLVRRGVYVNDRQVKRKVIDWGLDPLNPRVELTVLPMGQQEIAV